MGTEQAIEQMGVETQLEGRIQEIERQKEGWEAQWKENEQRYLGLEQLHKESMATLGVMWGNTKVWTGAKGLTVGSTYQQSLISATTYFQIKQSTLAKSL